MVMYTRAWVQLSEPRRGGGVGGCSAPVGQNRVTPQLVLDPSAPKAGRHTRFPYVSYAPTKVYTPSEVGRNFIVVGLR